ncbi:MAG: hypothetical protein P8Y47_13875 [Alphaproteobacteria bacterium]
MVRPATTYKLDTVQRLYLFGGLLDDLLINGDVIARIKAKFLEAKKSLVHTNDGFPSQKIKLHAVKRGAVGNENTAFVAMAIFQA